MTNYEMHYGSIGAAARTMAAKMAAAVLEASPVPVSCIPGDVDGDQVELAAAVMPALTRWSEGWLSSPSLGGEDGVSRYEDVYGTPDKAARDLAGMMAGRLVVGAGCMPVGFGFDIELLGVAFEPLREWALEWLNSPAGEVRRP